MRHTTRSARRPAGDAAVRHHGASGQMSARSVSQATKVVKRTVEALTDEIASELQEALKS